MRNCNCKMSLGSFEQCDPMDIMVRSYKPQYYDRSYYLAPTDSEYDTDNNAYMAIADQVQGIYDLSHQEPAQALAETAQVEQQAASTKKTFWVTAGIALFLI